MLLAIIDDYDFEIKGTSYDELESKMSFSYATHQNLRSFSTYQNIGQYEETISLKGTLICKSQRQLDDFEDIAKRKEAVTLAFASGKAYKVLILSLNKKRENFLFSGEFLKQDYDLALQVVGGK